MREWPLQSFLRLADRLTTLAGVPIVVLDATVGFDDMMSLVEHCDFFVGNDSGPAILAQCFSRPTFVIFGATDPALVLLHEDAVGIWKPVGCNGCKHYARHTDVECATPLCLATLTVDDVVTRMCESGWPRPFGHAAARL
jgi:heptosyltransferase-2